MSNTTMLKPSENVSTYRNRQLAPVLNRQGAQVNASMPQGPGLGVTASERMSLGQVQPGARASIDRARAAASRQHGTLMNHFHQQNLRKQEEERRRLEEEERQRQIAAQQQAMMQQMGGTWGVKWVPGPGGGGGALGGQYGLIPGADAAFQQMSAAFQQQFGYGIPVTEGGRTYERQQELYNLYLAGKGNLAAKPGTSLHESGRAVDLGGPFTNANSREHIWLQQNAHRWGYKWTGKNFSQFEPWHWEWHG